MIEIFLQIRKNCEKLTICLRNWENYSAFTLERRKKSWSESKMTNELITNDHVCNELITNQRREIKTCLREIAKDCEEVRKIEKYWQVIDNDDEWLRKISNDCEKLKNVYEWLTIMTNDWEKFRMIAKNWEMFTSNWQWWRMNEKCLRIIENKTNDCEWANHVFKKKLKKILKSLTLIFIYFVIYDRKMSIKLICDIHVDFTMIKFFITIKRLYCEFEKFHLNYDSKMR
jgi:hypothetical protein